MGPLKSLTKKTAILQKQRTVILLKPSIATGWTLCKNNILADVLVSMEPVLSAEGPHRLQLRGRHVNNVLFSVFSKSKNCWLCSKSVLFCFSTSKTVCMHLHGATSLRGTSTGFMVGVIPEQRAAHTQGAGGVSKSLSHHWPAAHGAAPRHRVPCARGEDSHLPAARLFRRNQDGLGEFQRQHRPDNLLLGFSVCKNKIKLLKVGRARASAPEGLPEGSACYLEVVVKLCTEPLQRRYAVMCGHFDPLLLTSC